MLAVSNVVPIYRWYDITAVILFKIAGRLILALSSAYHLMTSARCALDTSCGEEFKQLLIMSPI
jgi:hypothetical protein